MPSADGFFQKVPKSQQHQHLQFPIVNISDRIRKNMTAVGSKTVPEAKSDLTTPPPPPG